MQKKIMSWKTKGMNRDLSVSAFNPEFSFENMNLRLATNDGNTMLSWVTEKGPNQMTFSVNNVDSSSISGIPIGTAVIGDILVLFTTTRGDGSSQGDSNPDIIYTLNINFSTQKIDVDVFFRGNLQFDAEHPLETLVSYETDTIKKVYWVDGKNPFRMLNLSDKPVPSNSSYDNDVFNVLPTLQLQEAVYIDKIIGGSGKFASGVIQYAFTYFNKNGCESNIFYTSSLRYISPADRGGAPDEMVDNAFKIRIEKVDTRFDYIRIYSIHRSSLNGVPTCRRVADIDIRDVVAIVGNVPTVSYIDTGTVGDTIDPTELLFKNRETVIPSTIEQKDNTLFLGNIKKDSSFSIPNTIVSNHTLEAGHCTIAPEYNVIRMGKVDENSPFAHVNQLNLYTEEGDNADHTEHGVPCNGFKIGNTYRLGFQLQDTTGRWTDPIFIQNYPVPPIGSDYHAKTTINEETSIGSLQLPGIKATIDTSTSSSLIECGYRKIRPLVVLPKLQERKTICQGVVNPTLYTNAGRNNNNGNYGQSSWFFRPIPFHNSDFTDVTDENPQGWFSKLVLDTRESAQDERLIYVSSPKSNNGVVLPYTENDGIYNPRYDKGRGADASYVGNDLKTVEIQGYYDSPNRFRVDWRLLTFHSPDIELNEDLYNLTFLDTEYSYVGKANFVNTLSDISIQTTSPQIDGSSSGFIHNSYVEDKSYGIISGLFYEDAVVDDEVSGSDVKIQSFIDKTKATAEQEPCKWLIYPWQRSGSINNDFNRPSGLGVQSAYLKKKVISNLRFADTVYKTGAVSPQLFTKANPKVFFDENTLIKLVGVESSPSQLANNAFYYGDIDALLVPDKTGPLFYAFDGNEYNDDYQTYVSPSFNFYETSVGSRRYWKTWLDEDKRHGLWKFYIDNLEPWGEGDYPHWGIYHTGTSSYYTPNTDAIGDKYFDLVQSKDAVRMRYKSSPHMVIYDEAFQQTQQNRDTFPHNSDRDEDNFFLPIYEIQRQSITNIFGGDSLDALKANVWIVCGKEEKLKNSPVDIYPINNETVIHFSQGDNYYQRYDCLKTYAYSPEDVNQVVEIGSFMLEGYSNIDGRYDRNRGQINNTNISPENFNLINPVYSQLSNFFSYKIVEDNNSSTFINYLTWSLPKISGEDIDSWTYLTLANTLELEGNKGQLNSIKKFRNQLIAFQDFAVSQILYNENVQITSTEGVPIEIANSGKVEGYRYLSNTVGCSNKWSIVETPEGLYFMDGANKAIYLFNGGFNNISATGGFASWSTQNIAGVGNTWTPTFKTYPQQFGATEISPFVSYYDNLNHEVLFINADVALAWNERTQTFISFYNYEDTPYFVTLGDFQLWLRSSIKNNSKYVTAWHHQAGEETCNFFGERKPYWMTLISNPEPQTDKMFTNLEFRACVEGDGTWSGNSFTPTLPFNNLEVWNEYQHGIATLQNSQGHDLYSHHSNDDNTASLIRKFRIWRCDIPRDNAMVNSIAEAPKGIFREKCHPISRIRNPWMYLNIKKTPYVTYTCIKVPGTKGFLIPISEFEQYHEDTGLDACDIQIVDYVGTNLNVLYHLVDSSTMDIKYNYDSHTYYQLPLGQMHITDPTGGIIALGETYEADALFIDCSGWNFDPTTVELTIGRTFALTRTEIHDLTLTYYN